ncbi:MAG: hypothetical protein CL463_02525 [Acidimicrobiaceae bacterium]|nr:hypothetical protein [Acidimicrobiaceae bacterium]
MVNGSVRRAGNYLTAFVLLVVVAILALPACSSSDEKSSSSEMSSSSSSEASSQETSEQQSKESAQEVSDEGSEETTEGASEQTSGNSNEESPEESGQVRETLIDILASSLAIDNEPFVICVVDTTRENFGGPYQRLLDAITSDADTPKLDQAADEALQTCASELTADELALLGEVAAEAEEAASPPNDAVEEDSQSGGSSDDNGASGPPPPTVGTCATTIGVEYVPFYEFSQQPGVVMVGYGEVLNLYEEPDVSSSVVLTIPALDETIAYEGYSRSIPTNSWPYNTWHCITYNGFHGWVPDFYVSMLASPSAAWSGYGLVGLLRPDLESFEQDVESIFGGACPEYAGVGTQIVLSDVQTRAIGGDVTFDIRGWCDDSASGIRLTLTTQRFPSRQGSLEVTSAEIRPLCMRGVSGQNCV